MNRIGYFNYVEEELGALATRINAKGKLNILDLHVHSEDFYQHFLNKLFDWNLVNLNTEKQNVASIDLVDEGNQLILQVSATNTKQKIESALSKEIIKKYPNYTFKFVSISKDAADLRKLSFKNPHNITFSPEEDIIDNISILSTIKSLNIDKQKEIYELINKELGNEIDLIKLDSNLAIIINILSKENLNLDANNNPLSFEIEEKIAFNQLNATKTIIEDWATFYTRLEKKYKEFDSQGANKSLSVLQNIKSCYIKTTTKHPNESSDSIFLKVIELVKDKVIESANYAELPVDELELCVQIIVVDAFIKCKIFSNPQNKNYATTR